ncbi:MAG: Histone-lysine N-methyltransferase set9 [Claussenomyces sp. TS43310]|nr:MAG: Histone-lysine N-methyltransferase set9 [Claussenomyces sp. TS43310]
MPPKPNSPQKQRLTLAQLTAYDDILTDTLVDHVYYWTTIRKNRSKYHASRDIREEDVTSILQNAVVLEKNPAKAEAQLLALSGLRKFMFGLKSEKEQEDFKRHLRRYINIYMADCPFEVASTNRYTIVTHEAAVTARKFIKKGETVKYLCGVQVVMTSEEEDDINLRRRDFSIVISSRNKSASLFLGPARFANHDCNANARLMTTGFAGMEIIAVRNIDVGEEITVTYGDNYFGEDNCECLCKSCEDRGENGWSREDQELEVETAPKASIEQEPAMAIQGPITRNKKHETIDSSRNSSATPDLRPIVPKRTPKALARFSMQLSSPAQSLRSNESPQPDSKRKRAADTSNRPLCYTQKKPRSNKMKAEDVTGGIRTATLYATPISSRASSFESRDDPSPLSPSLACSTSTDLTLDEDSTNVEVKSGRVNSRSAALNAGRTAMDQVDSGDAILIDPSTSLQHPAIQGENNIEDAVNSETVIVQPQSVRRLKRPSTRLLAKTLAKLPEKAVKAKKAALPLPVTDTDHESRERRAGDYELTPLLLAQPASAWISCKICDGFFVQLDAYFTRSACPRCERHSKIYGYQWPKTDRESKHDDEERVIDHRTVHRFIRPDEERAIRKRDRCGSASRSVSTAGEPTETAHEAAEEVSVGRRSGRIRTKRARFTL